MTDFTVFKDNHGAWRWLAQTTTAFEDRDIQVLSLKALQADVARADADGKYGPLRLWHMGTPDATNTDAPWGVGLDIGWCDFNMMVGRTLVESGTFINDAVARWAEKAAPALGLSPGFFHPETEPDPSGVFTILRRFERSLAPTERVSNPFTAFYSLTRTTKESTMVDPAKISQLLDMGFDQKTLKGLLENVQHTEKTAEAAGIRFKEAQPATSEVLIGGVAYIPKPVEVVAAPVVEPVAEPEPVVATKETAPVAFDHAAFTTAISAAFKEAVAPLQQRLDMALSTTTKETQPAAQQEIATLKAQVSAAAARLAELEGDQTNVQRGFVASTAGGTVTKTAADLAVESQPQPLTEIEDVLAWTRQAIPQAVGAMPPVPSR